MASESAAQTVRPVASLNSGLLARKGAARPAMRSPLAASHVVAPGATIEDDLGWNDMGAPPEPEVVRQQQTIVAKLSEKSMAPAPKVDGRRAAFTLRLDAERHLRLRLASAVANRSAQQLVIVALDQYLASLPDLDALADQIKPNP